MLTNLHLKELNSDYMENDTAANYCLIKLFLWIYYLHSKYESIVSLLVFFVYVFIRSDYTLMDWIICLIFVASIYLLIKIYEILITEMINTWFYLFKLLTSKIEKPVAFGILFLGEWCRGLLRGKKVIVLSSYVKLIAHDSKARTTE